MRTKVKYSRSSGESLIQPVIDVKDGVQLSYNLENDAVRSFREGNHYTESYVVCNPTEANIASKPSLIAPYTRLMTYELPNSSWTERTRPVLLFSTTSGHTVTLTTEDHTMTVPCDDGVTLVYNLVPNRTYAWVESNSENEGTFTTTGQTRMIKIPLFNFRDVGGWPCYNDDGRIIGRIKYQKLYRGMCFAHKKDAGGDYIGGSRACYTHEGYPEVTQTLFNLGVTDDIDLRGHKAGHQAIDPDSLYKGTYAVNPLYPTVNGRTIHYSQGEIPAYNIQTLITSRNYNRDYDVVTDTSTSDYVYKILVKHLETVAATGTVPYVHCATGADRTGVFIAIIMALLGCSLEDIVKEYEYTTFNGMGQRVNIGWIKNGEIKGKPDGNIRTFLYSMIGNASPTNTTLGRTTVNRIVAFVKGCYTRQGYHTEEQWNDFLTRLRTKMIDYS